MCNQSCVPNVGYPFWLGSFFGALRFFIASNGLVREGYNKVIIVFCHLT